MCCVHHFTLFKQINHKIWDLITWNRGTKQPISLQRPPSLTGQLLLATLQICWQSPTTITQSTWLWHTNIISSGYLWRHKGHIPLFQFTADNNAILTTVLCRCHRICVCCVWMATCTISYKLLRQFRSNTVGRWADKIIKFGSRSLQGQEQLWRFLNCLSVCHCDYYWTQH